MDSFVPSDRDNNHVKGFAVTVMIVVTFSFTLCLGMWIGRSHMRLDAVESGHARYHPKTGVWEWLK